MKKIWAKVGTVAVAGALCLSIFGGCGVAAGENLSGYVAVDINPGIEFVTNANGYVTDVRAVNYDGEVLISDMDLTGKKIDVAVEEITNAAEEVGYINETNTDVSVTVGADDAKAEGKLEDLAKKGIKRGCEWVEIKADEIRTALEAEVGELKEEFKNKHPEHVERLTAAKLKVIKSIQEFDETFTDEEGLQMEMKDLIDMLEEHIDDHKDIIKGEMEIMFKEKFNEVTKEAMAQIDALFGEEYAAKMKTFRKLAILEDKFEYLLEKAEFEGGDGETLTAEMITELTTLIGENAITTIDALEDYVEVMEEELEAIMDSVELTFEQEILVETIKTQIKALRDGVLAEMKPHFEQMKGEFRDMKHELMNRHQGAGPNAGPGAGEVVPAPLPGEGEVA